MNQSQGGNPFGRLVEFARPHKTGYIVSVVLAVLGVAFGIVPYFATARMTIELLSGNRDLSFYMVWCLISGGCFVLKAILMGISTRASHEATFEVLSEARRKIAAKLTRVPMGYILNTPSGQLKNGMVERIEQLEVPLAHVIPEMTSNLLVPIAIIVYLFILDWRMAFVSLITIPVGMMCYMGMMKEYPKKYIIPTGILPQPLKALPVKGGVERPLPALGRAAAHRAPCLLRLEAAAGAQPGELLLLIQGHVGQAPHIVPVPHGPGPLLGGQGSEGSQHPPPQPLRPVLG